MSGLVHPHHMLQYHLISYFLARPQFLKPKMDNKAKGLGKFLRASWHMMSIGNSSWLRYNWTCSDDGLGFLTTNGRLCFLAGFDFAACFKQWAELMSAAKFSVMICNAHVQDSRVQLSSVLRNYNLCDSLILRVMGMLWKPHFYRMPHAIHSFWELWVCLGGLTFIGCLMRFTHFESYGYALEASLS